MGDLSCYFPGVVPSRCQAAREDLEAWGSVGKGLQLQFRAQSWNLRAAGRITNPCCVYKRVSERSFHRRVPVRTAASRDGAQARKNPESCLGSREEVLGPGTTSVTNRNQNNWSHIQAVHVWTENFFFFFKKRGGFIPESFCPFKAADPIRPHSLSLMAEVRLSSPRVNSHTSGELLKAQSFGLSIGFCSYLSL